MNSKATFTWALILTDIELNVRYDDIELSSQVGNLFGVNVIKLR